MASAGRGPTCTVDECVGLILVFRDLKPFLPQMNRNKLNNGLLMRKWGFTTFSNYRT